MKGYSYPQEWYEDAVGELLGKVGDLDDRAVTEVVRLYSAGPGHLRHGHQMAPAEAAHITLDWRSWGYKL